jgi:tyrosine phenol-lyase
MSSVPIRREPAPSGAVGESFRIKMVQTLRKVPYDVRVAALKEADYNVLRLPRDRVYLDFGTARGNAGLTDKQLSALMIGDEAYAGSANFYALQQACQEVFGKRFTIPTHQGRGAEHLILRGLLRPGDTVLTNGNLGTLAALAAALDLRVETLLAEDAYDPRAKETFKADLPVERVEKQLEAGKVQLLLVGATVPQFGGQPLSLENLEACAALARRYGVPVILDASMAASAAFLYKVSRAPAGGLPDLIRRYADACDILYLSGREDAGCHTGGLIATNEEQWYVVFRSLVVVYEGLHTYGGQAGRDMQVLAQGLRDMLDESYLAFRRRKLEYLAGHLEEAGYPVHRPLGLSGVVIDTSSVSVCGLTGLGHHTWRSANLAALCYLVSGIRTRPLDRRAFGRQGDLLGVYVPRRCYTERQIDYLIESFEHLARYHIVHPLRVREAEAPAPELMRFAVDGPFITEYHDDFAPTHTPEPYFIKVVEPFRLKSAAERTRAIRDAGFNTFLLRSEDIYIDLLTDSGTAAMSNRQWAMMLEVQESELGSEASRFFMERCREVLGFRYILPTHQGRAAEHLLSQAMIGSGQYVINNMYFTTTREHQERAGGVFVDLIVDEAYDPRSAYPFKGDIDPKKLIDFIAKRGAERIAYVCIETNVNMAGGQPVSLGVTKEVSAICRYHRIPVIFDATRVAENAYLIKQRETAYADWTIKEIIRELMAQGDGCTISAKKDVLVNIGGILGVNDPKLYERCAALCATFEGTPWSGGLASRDLAAMAVGLEEMTDYDYISSRVEQVHYLWSRVKEAGVPVVEPPGGHAVFLDAQAFLPHIPQEEFPAQRLAAALYETAGVRGMERGIVSAGRDPATGRHRGSKLELVRLTIPRRVYTYSHMDVVADGVIDVFRNREQLTGLRMVYEPPTLRFFTARFEPR